MRLRNLGSADLALVSPFSVQGQKMKDTSINMHEPAMGVLKVAQSTTNGFGFGGSFF